MQIGDTSQQNCQRRGQKFCPTGVSRNCRLVGARESLVTRPLYCCFTTLRNGTLSHNTLSNNRLSDDLLRNDRLSNQRLSNDRCGLGRSPTADGTVLTRVACSGAIRMQPRSAEAAEFLLEIVLALTLRTHHLVTRFLIFRFPSAGVGFYFGSLAFKLSQELRHGLLAFFWRVCVIDLGPTAKILAQDRIRCRTQLRVGQRIGSIRSLGVGLLVPELRHFEKSLADGVLQFHTCDARLSNARGQEGLRKDRSGLRPRATAVPFVLKSQQLNFSLTLVETVLNFATHDWRLASLARRRWFRTPAILVFGSVRECWCVFIGSTGTEPMGR